jgi:hypothetical protein
MKKVDWRARNHGRSAFEMSLEGCEQGWDGKERWLKGWRPERA